MGSREGVDALLRRCEAKELRVRHECDERGRRLWRDQEELLRRVSAEHEEALHQLQLQRDNVAKDLVNTWREVIKLSHQTSRHIFNERLLSMGPGRDAESEPACVGVLEPVPPLCVVVERSEVMEASTPCHALNSRCVSGGEESRTPSVVQHARGGRESDPGTCTGSSRDSSSQVRRVQSPDRLHRTCMLGNTVELTDQLPSDCPSARKTEVSAKSTQPQASELTFGFQAPWELPGMKRSVAPDRGSRVAQCSSPPKVPVALTLEYRKEALDAAPEEGTPLEGNLHVDASDTPD